MNYIEVENLVKTFSEHGKKVIAVDNVSFNVKQGEIFGFLGPNGAGKTTTINMLTGLLKKDSGTIRILGYEPEKNWEFVKNQMNVSTAYFPLSDVLTVEQNLKVYARIFNVKNSKERINELIRMFELENVRKRSVIKLSSGENTRVSLAKGLVNMPKVLFLDECTVGLDPDMAEKTRTIIKNYQKNNDCSIMFTSHYMYEVEELCDRIAFMCDGRIIKIDTADNLKKLIKKNTVEIAVKENAIALKKFLEDENVDVCFAENNTVIFDVTSENDKLFKVMNKIFKKGFMLSNLHIKKPTLDDIFIKIARKK